MNQHIDVEIEIVPLDGRNVLLGIIIVVSQAGCFVMEKMIVEIILTKLLLNIVQNVTKLETLNVKMVVVFH